MTGPLARRNQYKPGSATYDALRIELIEGYAPDTEPCHWCRGPVISGYSCTWCGCTNPSGQCQTHKKEREA